MLCNKFFITFVKIWWFSVKINQNYHQITSSVIRSNHELFSTKFPSKSFKVHPVWPKFNLPYTLFIKQLIPINSSQFWLFSIFWPIALNWYVKKCWKLTILFFRIRTTAWHNCIFALMGLCRSRLIFTEPDPFFSENRFLILASHPAKFKDWRLCHPIL